MSITDERQRDELTPDQATDLLATLHERLLERLKTHPVHERFAFDGFEVASVDGRVHVTALFRTAEGPQSVLFQVERAVYAKARTQLLPLWQLDEQEGAS